MVPYSYKTMDQTSPTSAAPRALPGAWDLIKDTGDLFKSTWKTTTRTSIFFLYMGLLYFVGALFIKWSGAFVLVTLLLSLIIIVLTAWVSLRLMLMILKLNDGQTPLSPEEEAKKAWSLFWPSLWVGILTTLVVFGASILLIIPGIYFSIALSFSIYTLVDQNIRGTQALSASRALVKGRWWSVLWRQFVGGLIFGLIFTIIMAILGAIIGMIFALTGAGPKPGDIVFSGATQFLQMAGFVIFFPITVIFQTKIYRALQKTR